MSDCQLAILRTAAITLLTCLSAWIFNQLMAYISGYDITLALAGLTVMWWLWVVYKINLSYITITKVLEDESKKLK